MSIPGLDLPFDGATGCADLQLVSFNLKPFTVPGSHVYGKCRPITDYDKISIVGEGVYGTVYKAKEKKSGQIVAIKKLKVPKQEMMAQTYLREISNLKLMKHDNIANLITVAVGKSIESTHLILDYCEYSLSKVIDKVDQALLRIPQIKCIMVQLYNGLDYIHKHHIFHRNVSPMNVCFNDLGILKIIDFGLSRKISSGDITPAQGFRCYKSPEILFGSLQYSSSLDIWASGCIFGEILSGRVLFSGSTDCEVIQKIIQLLGTPTESLWPGFSELPVPKHYELNFQPYNRIRSTFQRQSLNTVSMIQETLCYNPVSRPSAEECLRHNYFEEYPQACTSEELIPILQASVH